MPFIPKRSSGAFSINSPKMTLHIHDLIALFWTLDLESYYSRWTSTMADSTIDESTFLGFLSLLFFSSFFLRWRCAVARQWQFSVAVQCTMVWTTTDVRESSCYDYDDHSTEIESKRLSYFLKSALAHAFFYTTKDTTFSKASSSSSPGASAKVAFMWPFLPLWKYRQFSWAKNISSWKMHRMWWKRLCSDYT